MSLYLLSCCAAVVLLSRYPKLTIASFAWKINNPYLLVFLLAPHEGTDLSLDIINESQTKNNNWVEPTTLSTCLCVYCHLVCLSIYLPFQELAKGTYRVIFDTESYFRLTGAPCFYPEVTVVFRIEDPSQHFHIPLLISPFGYSTYRGSWKVYWLFAVLNCFVHGITMPTGIIHPHHILAEPGLKAGVCTVVSRAGRGGGVWYEGRCSAYFSEPMKDSRSSGYFTQCLVLSKTKNTLVLGVLLCSYFFWVGGIEFKE